MSKQQAMDTRLSKMMTKLLRHTPEEFGLVLDPKDGSCPLSDLLTAINAQPRWSWVKREDIERVVRNSNKQRFDIENGRIRARYGHSYDKIQYSPGEPPAVLYHGTNRQALPAILKEGIRPMGRQYVHLSQSTHFATLAGSRRGELAILKVDTQQARQWGVQFYHAGGEVWLADEVPKACLTVWTPQDKEHGSRL